MRVRWRFVQAISKAVLLGLLLAWAAQSPATAQEQAPAPKQLLEDLFTNSEYPESWFAPQFLSKVSPSQLADVVKKLTTDYGPFEAIESSAGRYFAHLRRALVPIEIGFDGQGRVSTLLAKPAVIKYADFKAAETALAALPGEVSLLVLRNGQQQAARKPDRKLAVGSAFKLAVLNALVEQVKSGQRSWDDLVALSAGRRALPSGMLQAWPAGINFTLGSLAGLMISISDNTAADLLIDLVGRDAVEAFAPENRPFLTTREFFQLKAPANRALRERYRKADPAGREQVLKELAALPLPAAAEVAAVYTPAIEWHFSTKELCDLIASIADQPAMHINPGVAIPAQWAEVAFKGGSDFGVLNLTTQVKAQDGTVWCAAVTWNNPKGAEQVKLLPIYGGLLLLLNGSGG